MPSPAQERPGPSYRHDLDGLRGVAITLVVVHHVWTGRVSGGVDVFLTLSGFFLATTLLSRLRRLEEGRLLPALGAVVGTWLRIARRLLPAATMTLAGVLVATALFLPRTRWEETARQVLASLGYVENRHLAANQLDYAAAGLAASPVQHFWSLSVQGQLFLVIPPIVLLTGWALRRLAPRVDLAWGLAAVLGALAVGSFSHALAAVSENQSQAYYDTAARAWEVLLGAVVAVLLPPLAGLASRVPAPLRSITGHTALAGILVAGFLLEGATQFPGWQTLGPVLATLVIVVTGTLPAPWSVTRPLASAGARWLGSRAYAFYLWHWPVLIVYLGWRGLEQAELADGVAVIVCSLLLAALTERLIERPLRSTAAPRAAEPSRRRFILPRPGVGTAAPAAMVAAALALALTAIAPRIYLADLEERRVALLATDAVSAEHPGALVTLSRLPNAQVPSAPLVPSLDLARSDVSDLPDPSCVTTLPRRLTPCDLVTTPGGPTVALVGASHSTHLFPALESIARDRGLTLRGYLTSGCPWGGRPGLQQALAEEARDCLRYSRDVTDRLIAERPDIVVTIGTRGHLSGLQGDRVPDANVIEWRRVEEAGIKLVLIRDNPRFATDVPDCVARHLDDGIPAVNRRCGAPRWAPLTRRLELGHPALPQAAWIDLTDAYCRPRWCNVIEGNVLLYRDRHHLTATYVRTLAPELDRQLGTATGWWSAR